MKLTRMLPARHVARIVRLRNTNKILVGKPEGKKSLGRSMHKRKMVILEMKICVNWIHMTEDAVT
jgi:hypothetical protein